MAEKTDAWEAVRRERARAWLDDTSGVIRTVRALEGDLMAEYGRGDLLGAQRYGDHVACGSQTAYDDRVAAHIDRMDEIASRLNGMSAEWSEKYKTALDVFRRLECHYLADPIMNYRYILLMGWSEVADNVGISIHRVYQIHRMATLECYDLMPAEWRVRVPAAV